MSSPGPTVSPLLEAANLSVELNGRQIVSEVSFSIAPATIVGLFGESGCGKTTLAMGLLKLLPAPYRISGTARLEGADLLTLSERQLQPIRGGRIAMVLQDPLLALNPVLRVDRQIDEVRRAHPSRALERDRLFELVGLPESRRRAYPHQLSGGERQRVLLAQALACQPSVIIADEPFTALDAVRSLELSALFRDLKEKLRTSFLLISHHPGTLAGIADRMLVMYDGSIVERGTAREVLGDPRHPYTAGLLRSFEPCAEGRLYSLPGNPPNGGPRTPGCPFEPRCAERVERCATQKPPEVADYSRSVRCFKYAG